MTQKILTLFTVIKGDSKDRDPSGEVQGVSEAGVCSEPRPPPPLRRLRAD